MISKAIATVSFLLYGSTLFAQDKVKLIADLDGDGKNDVIWVSGDKLQCKLTSLGNSVKSSKPLGIDGMTNSLKLYKNVVGLRVWAMRGGSEYKLRYDKAAGDLRVIGYDSENFGPATNDGSGSSSYNLLTGDYVANWNHYDDKKEKLVPLPAIRKKIPAKKYYLSALTEASLNDIGSIDTKFLPKELK